MANPKIQLRHDTSTNWQTQNPVLLEGEVAIETDSNKVKIGNGTDNYNALPYITDQTKIDLDYSNADYQPVNKAGDTMTGYLALKFSELDLSTTSSDNTFRGVEIQDTNGERVGRVEGFQKNNGDYGVTIGTKVYGARTYPKLEIWLDSSNNAHSSFPNTICCDGQYVNTNTTIATNVSVNGSSPLVYTLNLPSDGCNYMVWIMVKAETDTASGNYVNAQVGSDIMTSIILARATTRTASSVSAGSTACIVVSSSHKIYLSRMSSWKGTVNLFMIGYRRIGTNA